jgi:hypothetical protein
LALIAKWNKMNNRKSKLLKIQKRYLSLIYQLNQYRLNGEDPPDDLIEAISDMERIVKIIARAGRS